MPPTTRIVMLGTGDFALPTFEHLCDEGAQVVALVTQPDRPQGRKQADPQPDQARRHRTRNPRRAARECERSRGTRSHPGAEPDLLVTAAYGQILSPELLGLPALGGINLHGSVLPAYRGAAPVARPSRTVSRDGRDCDPHDAADRCRGDDRPRPDIHRPRRDGRRARRSPRPAGSPLLARAIADLVAGPVRILPQDRLTVTKAPKFPKEDGEIEWSGSARGSTIASAPCSPGRPRPPSGTAATLRRDAAGPPDRPQDLARGRRGEAGRGPRSLRRPADRRRGRGAVRLLTLQVPGKKPTASPSSSEATTSSRETGWAVEGNSE